MAIPTYRSYSLTSIISNTQALVPKPSGLTVGDLMLANILVNSSATITGVPSGWTLLDISLATGRNRKSAIYYKIATSGDVSASTFEWTFNGNTSSINSIVAFATPPSTYLGIHPFSESSGTTTMSISSKSLTHKNSTLLIFANQDTYNIDIANYQIATSNPTWTEVYDTNEGDISVGRNAFAYSSQRPENTDTGTISCTGASNNTIHFIELLTTVQTTTETDSLSLSDSIISLRKIMTTQSESLSISDSTESSKSRLWAKPSKPTTVWNKPTK